MTMEGISVGDDKDLQQVWGLLMKGALVLMIIAGALGACSYLNQEVGLPDDNHVESFFESIVEFQLGLPQGSVDFTPEQE